ncbi:aldehyde dehydrogenase 3 A2 [Obelidium mucronatum]|nr:aldehyde dehydrogenase 3 A2 [Obelidium mucronatum]
MATTPVTEIPHIVNSLRKTFESNKTKPIAWRKRQLQNLYRFLTDHEKVIGAALAKDLNRPMAEIANEIRATVNECSYALDHIDEWTKPRKCKPNLALMMDTTHVRHEPLGVVCIIAPWNFPINLLFVPIIHALAAGNCIVAKPSEVSTACESLVAEWVPKVLDPEAVKVVVGGVGETSALLEQKFDHVFFTGSPSVGKVVLQACAKHLVPATLELGGKSPVYVHSDANIAVIANRLCWAKALNCGQICVAPDYVLVHKDAKDSLIEAIKKSFTEMLSTDVKSSKAYARIINRNHTQRLLKVLSRQLAQAHSKLEYGGEHSVEDCFITPSVVSGVKLSDPLMEDEIFGPLLGIVEVANENEAISIIKSRPRPLSMYVCTESKAIANKFLDNTLSGSILINGFLMNFFVEDMPFGGVGNSGMGKCHGHAGFMTFTHERGLVWRSTGPITESASALMYPPFNSSPTKLSLLKLLAQKKPTTFLKKLFSHLFAQIWVYFKLWVIFRAGVFVGLEGGWVNVVGKIQKLLA